MNLIKLRPKTCLKEFLGFLVKTKIKAYKKMTVVMCCQIVARKSVAPSSSDFRRRFPAATCDMIRKFEEKKFWQNNYYTALTAAAGLPLVCNLNDFSRATYFLCLAGLARGSLIEYLTLIFLCFKKYFFLKYHGDL